MKLISLYVESFGRLSEFEYTFNQGVNCFLQDNSWGKSTLAAFIKAMFYGFAQTRSPDITKNDRKKFAPWDGKSFGGSLTFEEGERIYRIERTFTKSGKDDFFRLTDAATGKECSDYTENIGCELFGINACAFERSVFVSRNVMGDDKGEGSRSIIKKLSGTIDDSDLENFNRAMKILDDKRKLYNVTRGGLIGQCRERISDMERALRERLVLEEELKEKNSALSELTLRIDGAQKRQSELSGSISESNRKKERLTLLDGYLKVRARFDSLEREYLSLSRFFGAGVPDSGTLDGVSRKIARFEVLEKDIEGGTRDYCLEYLEQSGFFGDGCPPLEEFKRAQREYLLAKSELERVPVFTKPQQDALSELEGLPAPSDGELEVYSEDLEKARELKSRIGFLEEGLESTGTPRSKGKASPLSVLYFAIAVLGALLMVSGAVCFVSLHFSLALILALSGLAIEVLSVFLYLKDYLNKRLEGSLAPQTDLRRELELRSAELSALEQKCALFESRYSIDPAKGEGAHTFRDRIGRYSLLYSKKLEAEQELERAQSRLDSALDTIASLYARMSHPELDADELEEVIERYEHFLAIKDSALSALEDASHAGAELELIKKEVFDFLDRYPCEGVDCVQRLARITSQTERLLVIAPDYMQTKKELDTLHKKLPEYAECGISLAEKERAELEGASDSAEEDKRELEECSRLILSLEKSRASLTLECSELRSDIEKDADLEERIRGERECLAGLEYRLKVIESTKALLEQAKENLSVRYLGRMRERFSHYLELLSSDLMLKGELDTELEVSVSGGGIMRESEYFSTGCRDLLFLALHLALSDVIFEKESCFLILDDPFVNLDKTRLEGARALVSKLAADRQIIYFTCHESRQV